MDIGTLSDYFVIMVIGFCVGIGYIIKHLIPTDKINRFIPFIMAICGIGFNIWINKGMIVPEVILGGMISGLASTGAYEAFRNLIGDKEEK